MSVASQESLQLETVNGVVTVLTEVIELSYPTLLGRSYAIEQLMGPVMQKLGCEDRWEYALAARLANLGRFILMAHSPDQAESLSVLPLTEDETEVARFLILYIPHLEAVANIVSRLHVASGEFRVASVGEELQSEDIVVNGASVARAVLLMQGALQGGTQKEDAAQAVKDKMPLIDARIIDALLTSDVAPQIASDEVPTEIQIRRLQEGMILAQDVELENGMTLLRANHKLNRVLIARLRSIARRGLLDERVLVYAKSINDR